MRSKLDNAASELSDPPCAASQQDGPVGPNVAELFRSLVRPAHDNRFHVGALAKAKMNPDIAGAQVAGVGVHAAPERRLASSGHADCGAHAEAIGSGTLQPDLQPMVFPGALILEQPYRSAIRGDHDVHSTIVIDVAESRPTADLFHLERVARQTRDILELTAVAGVVE